MTPMENEIIKGEAKGVSYFDSRATVYSNNKSN